MTDLVLGDAREDCTYRGVRRTERLVDGHGGGERLADETLDGVVAREVDERARRCERDVIPSRYHPAPGGRATPQPGWRSTMSEPSPLRMRR